MPVDSEHFSIWASMNTHEIKNIDKVYKLHPEVLFKIYL